MDHVPTQPANSTASNGCSRRMKNFPPQQIEFPGLLFPGRQVLYVFEVAERLCITEQHVLDLIEEGKIKGVKVAGVNATDRKYWRIPNEAYEKYLAENLSVPPQPNPQKKL